MTAMADMMFQLLIFFMLSSNLVPFSMLDIRTGGVRGGAAAPGEATQAEAAANTTDLAATAIWTVGGDGRITASGQRFAPDRLSALADALVAQGTDNVLVVAGEGVRVQQVVTVLEVLAARGITSVQLAGGE